MKQNLSKMNQFFEVLGVENARIDFKINVRKSKSLILGMMIMDKVKI